MKGIMFRPEMIQAIVEGRKTQTRRLGGLKGINVTPDIWECLNPNAHHLVTFYNEGTALCTRIKPPYQVGETVYIKEAHMAYDRDLRDIPSNSLRTEVEYRDGRRFWCPRPKDKPIKLNKWHSPMTMPEWAARYFITITDVRAERLQEITRKDCIAEGIQSNTWSIGKERMIPKTDFQLKEQYPHGFKHLWNSINKEKWESNPFAWVYTFSMFESRVEP